LTYPGEDALSHALAAVAHPVRRDLLAQVCERPVRVTDLAAGFDISLPAVSRHLKVLENAGLVTRSIEGRDHFIAGSDPISKRPGGIHRSRCTTSSTIIST
jgi:DNA-binding transcriptional ArsR family regulator